jgi:hypothetical protein
MIIMLLVVISIGAGWLFELGCCERIESSSEKGCRDSRQQIFGKVAKYGKEVKYSKEVIKPNQIRRHFV